MPNDKLPNKIKFLSKLPSEKSNFFYAISKDNGKQTGYNFSLYINWVIENKDKVKCLKIILSDYLNRFYVGEEKALQWGESWKEVNQKYLDKLTEADIPFELIDWKSLINSKSYFKWKVKVNELYIQNQEFITAVDGLAHSHQHKAGFKQAVEYLKEESAGITSLEEGILTYPAPNLNGAIHCTLKNLNCGLSYIGHMFIHSKSAHNPQYVLQQSTFKALCALEQAGYKESQAKHQFFINAIKSYEPKKNKNNFSLFSACLTKFSEKLTFVDTKILKETYLPTNTSGTRLRLYSI